MEILTKSQYTQHLADLNNPLLAQAWGIEQICYDAQIRKQTEVNFNTTENPPIIVPLQTITYLVGKYQWDFTTTNEPNQMRKISKITLV